MRALRSWPVLLGTLALAGLPAPAGAQPVGAEFQINTYTTSNQATGRNHHLVAADASGNFVVVWNDQTQDGGGYGVFGQRYDSAGQTLGSEFRVNSYTTQVQGSPSAAAAADGDFVVVWMSYTQDGSSRGVFGQRYDSGGGALGTEFRVNSYTTGSQSSPSVASDASGNFVVVWTSDQPGFYGIFGQRYDSGGVTQGGEFRINSDTRSDAIGPSVASDASGNFVVVWRSGCNFPGCNGGSTTGISGQRYDSAGVAQGEEFRVNSYTTNAQTLSSVASDASGNFIVVWQSFRQEDGGGWGIFGQRYDSEGVAQGDEFHVNAYTPNGQEEPSVASDASGNFVVAWQAALQDGSNSGVFGQRYDSAGVAQGDEFQINSFTTRFQRNPSVWATGTNQFVVAWDSAYQDGSGVGVFGQRFAFTGGDTITVVSPNTNVEWQIGSLQRIKWSHNLGLGETFRLELDRDDDGVYEELIAANALADGARQGHFAWTVTGPPSATARVRVSWTDDLSVADSSDVTFEITTGFTISGAGRSRSRK